MHVSAVACKDIRSPETGISERCKLSLVDAGNQTASQLSSPLLFYFYLSSFCVCACVLGRTNTCVVCACVGKSQKSMVGLPHELAIFFETTSFTEPGAR